MGVSGKHQVDGGGCLESEGKKWVISGISLRPTPLKPLYNTNPAADDDHSKDRQQQQQQQQQDKEDESCCSTTPTGQDARIPTLFTCPPAPIKRKPSLKCNYASVREFFTPPDLETVFIRHV